MLEKTEKLLKLVSRSFSICIPMLPKKVRKNVGNFYLLCRYADSIEDSKLSFEDKTKYFKEFVMCVKEENEKEIINLNKKLLPFIIYDNDKKMVKAFNQVLKEFVSFDVTTKKISKKWLSTMVRGMQKYSKKQIDDFSDLNNYCYFVAGTVGMYLTEMFEYKFDIAKKVGLNKKAKDFGLLLQKVNIIRDFSKDYKEGRMFWPKKLFAKHNVSVENVFEEKHDKERQMILKEMILNTKKNIINAIEYIELLPQSEKMLRTFCAIPFCMALPTLLKCEGNEKVFDVNEKVKIDRIETYKILDMINSNVSNEKFATNYYESLKARV